MIHALNKTLYFLQPQKTVFAFLMVISALYCHSQSINISVFNDYSTRSIVISALHGRFHIIADGKTIHKLNENEYVYLSLVGNAITASGNDIHFRKLTSVRCIPLNNSVVQIRPVNPLLHPRQFTGDLTISVDFNRLLMINQMKLSDYLAGVVQAEGGSSKKPEYYKAQAILCRTYALANIERHIQEGFHLCDGTHCQAFKGSIIENNMITKAVSQTKDLVVMDPVNQLITAAYHSNSGGMTEKGMNVWLTNLPYLISINDPYSLSGRNATWETELQRENWENYLIGNGLIPPLPESYTKLNKQRARYYTIKNVEIPYSKIRKDWNLRSSFFSVVDNGPRITIQGRGYGHGVGLSQEGAMEMARQGFEFNEIIHHYFNNVKIVSIDPIPYLTKH